MAKYGRFCGNGRAQRPGISPGGCGKHTLQTYTDLELIIVNDASTDKTGEILERVTDERVTVIHLAENRGAAAALNLGIEQAKGDWIAIHDADDISYPNRIERQMRYLQGPRGPWP